jgi:hypothetical protein
MPFDWYQEVAPEVPLTQGDLLRGCPIMRWDVEATPEQFEGDNPQEMLVAEEVDCIVMSQACDLEHGHIREVILCPAYPLSEYRTLWQEDQRSRNQNPTDKNWRNHLDDIQDGKIWNLAMINERSPADEGSIQIEIQIVDFHEIRSVPRAFVENWAARIGGRRLRLLPPYREHLSQAFARYFMRVGLPIDIAGQW